MKETVLFLEGVLHELRENATIERSMDINEPDDVKRTFRPHSSETS